MIWLSFTNLLARLPWTWPVASNLLVRKMEMSQYNSFVLRLCRVLSLKLVILTRSFPPLPTNIAQHVTRWSSLLCLTVSWFDSVLCMCYRLCLHSMHLWYLQVYLFLMQTWLASRKGSWQAAFAFYHRMLVAFVFQPSHIIFSAPLLRLSMMCSTLQYVHWSRVNSFVRVSTLTISIWPLFSTCLLTQRNTRDLSVCLCFILLADHSSVQYILSICCFLSVRHAPTHSVPSYVGFLFQRPLTSKVHLLLITSRCPLTEYFSLTHFY